VGNRYFSTTFRLIGIETIEAADDDSAAEKVEDLVSRESFKVIIISEKVAPKLSNLRQNLLRTRRFYPIFVIIPDFEGPLNERMKELNRLVSQSIGVELKLGK
jgi:vacuolar-type H+-ATPase subunit F/Vma7